MTSDAEVDDRAGVEPPRWVVVLATLTIALCCGMTLAGGWVTGISVDENYHVVRLQTYLDSGRYAVPQEVPRGDGTPAANTHVYAPVTTLTLQALAVAAGQGDWDTVSDSTTAYAVRHVGVALIGMLGLASVGFMVRLLVGSWRWGVVAAAVLGAIPMWTGHSMFNVKDVPVAVGFSTFSVGLMAIVVASRRGHRGGKEALGPLAVLVGVLLMVGTRPGMWPAVVVAVLAVLAPLVLGRRVSVRLLATIVAPVLLATAMLVAIYPAVFARPAGWWTAATASSDFGEVGAFGRAYIPAYVLTEYPLLILTGLLLGLASLARRAIRDLLVVPEQAALIAVPLVQALFLPAVAFVLNSPLYGGLRQLLFIVPATAVLATCGFVQLIRDSDRSRRWRGRRVSWALVALAFTLPTVSQGTVFPYQYSWQNVLADAVGLPGGTDYWRTTFHEYVDAMPTDGLVVCDPIIEGATAVRGRPDGSIHDCRVDPIGPLASEWREKRRPVGGTLRTGDFYGAFVTGNPLPPNCVELDRVVRWRHGRTVVLSRLGRCTDGG